MLREDISAHDVLRLVHGITIATETSPADADRLLALVLDGLRPQATTRHETGPLPTADGASRRLRRSQRARSI